MAPASPTASPFTPIVVEAESPGNVLVGSAAVVRCGPCQGGYRVRYLGGPDQLVVKVVVPVDGERRVSIVYECDGPRTIKIRVNGTFVHRQDVTGPGWETPVNFSFTTQFPAGAVEITLFNDESSAPDIDAVVIS